MSESKKQSKIFLCHASEDKDRVYEIYNKLKKHKLEPWLDKEDLLPGQNWQLEIPKALKKSKYIIIFFSENSVSKRGYVQREFKLALDTLKEIPEGEIFIIPVRLDKCQIPPAFGNIQHSDIFKAGEFEKVLKILGVENALLDKNKIHDSINFKGSILGSFTDPRDGQVYKTVRLRDGKVWFAENLNFDTGKRCWHYDMDIKNEKYGRLYTLESAIEACPPGWHLPSHEEIEELQAEYGNGEYGYKYLIEGGSSGFSAQFGGRRKENGDFWGLGTHGFYWVNNVDLSLEASSSRPILFDKGVKRIDDVKLDIKIALSVRCIMD